MVSISKRRSLPLTKDIKTHTLTTQGCIGRWISITTIIQKALSKKKILLLMKGIKTNMLTNLRVTDGWMIYENMLYNYFKKERSAPHTGRNRKYADPVSLVVITFIHRISPIRQLMRTCISRFTARRGAYGRITTHDGYKDKFLRNFGNCHFISRTFAPHERYKDKYVDQLTVYRQMDRIEHLTTMM